MHRALTKFSHENTMNFPESIKINLKLFFQSNQFSRLSRTSGHFPIFSSLRLSATFLLLSLRVHDVTLLMRQCVPTFYFHSENFDSLPCYAFCVCLSLSLSFARSLLDFLFSDKFCLFIFFAYKLYSSFACLCM